MICNNCGNEIPEGSSYCNKCGKKIEAETESKEIIENITDEVIKVENVEKEENTTNQNDNIINEDYDKNANYLTILSSILIFLVPILRNIILKFTVDDDSNSSVIDFIRSMSMLAGVTILIYTRIKYPKNNASKIVLIVFLGLILVWVIITIIAIVSCMSALNNCPG